MRCGLTLGMFELQRGQVLRENEGNSMVLFVGFKPVCRGETWEALETE
jgi:hypothetical protein